MAQVPMHGASTQALAQKQQEAEMIQAQAMADKANSQRAINEYAVENAALKAVNASQAGGLNTPQVAPEVQIAEMYSPEQIQELIQTQQIDPSLGQAALNVAAQNMQQSQDARFAQPTMRDSLGLGQI